MKIKIYCITDINNLNYVGATIDKLNSRLYKHRYDKKNNKNKTSRFLDLYDCEIKLLEECEYDNKNEREQYWIDNTVCVNRYNPVSRYHEWRKEYNTIYNKQYRKYKKSWGGDKRFHNNLLSIDTKLFVL
tara:strand:+ start:49 stop:438 length:390 start_codon:yes stop_codon:yes gene_type:complete